MDDRWAVITVESEDLASVKASMFASHLRAGTAIIPLVPGLLGFPANIDDVWARDETPSMKKHIFGFFEDMKASYRNDGWELGWDHRFCRPPRDVETFFSQMQRY